MDCSLPGSSVHRILQVRVLEWVAMPSSRDLPNLRIEAVSPASPALQVDSLTLSHPQNPLLIALEIERGLCFATVALDFLKPC